MVTGVDWYETNSKADVKADAARRSWGFGRFCAMTGKHSWH